MQLSLPEVDGSLAGDFVLCQCSSLMVTTDLSSLLGKQVGNPDSNLEQQSSQLISLAGCFCCHLPGLQKGSWICEFYSVSLSQGAMFVPAFGWQLLTVSTHWACWGHFAQRLNFLPTQQWLARAPEDVHELSLGAVLSLADTFWQLCPRMWLVAAAEGESCSQTGQICLLCFFHLRVLFRPHSI